MSPDEIATRISALPGVAVVVAEEAPGVPASMVGARFFFVGEQRLAPFATIVEHDTPGWDEVSRLDRPGVYRLSIQLGRAVFTDVFGYAPRQAEERMADADPAALDVLMPHPQYARQGWGCILSPTTRSLPEVDRLLRHAVGRRAGAPRPDGAGA